MAAASARSSARSSAAAPSAGPMNAHALAVLEFPRVLALVAERASSELGAARVRSLVPSPDIAALEREHARVAAMRAMVGGDAGWRPEAIPPMEPALDRLRISGAPWSGVEALGGLTLLRSSRRTRAALTDERRMGIATAALAPFVPRLADDRAAEARIERAIADGGSVRDDAPPARRSLRRVPRGAQGELIKRLERVMAGLADHHGVSDMSVTVRNGRYVIPIRREGRGEVGGIVHDASATGATLFVEPPAAVEMMNRLRTLEAEEAREVTRILRELTTRLRPLQPALLASLDALVALDSLYARARYALRTDGRAPKILEAGTEEYEVVRGYHPILQAKSAEVVPFVQIGRAHV